MSNVLIIPIDFVTYICKCIINMCNENENFKS